MSESILADPRKYWPTMPSDFPLDYLLAPQPGGHQLFAKCRWTGPSGDFAEGFEDYWEMGCLKEGCDVRSVLRMTELLDSMRRGLVVGKRCQSSCVPIG